MTTKKTTKADSPDREKLERACKSIHDYLKLSSYLFGDNAPYEMNEIDEKSPYYELARELADEMEVDWKTMSHQDSNRVMLALLDDCFQSIRESEDEMVLVEIKVKRIDKKESKADGDVGDTQSAG